MALASSSAAHLLQNSYPGLALSSWHCSSVLAGTLLLSITLVGSRALCSSFGGKLFSPSVSPLIMQQSAFSVVAHSIWNLLLLEI